jgi:hypothetical protein
LRSKSHRECGLEEEDKVLPNGIVFAGRTTVWEMLVLERSIFCAENIFDTAKVRNPPMDLFLFASSFSVDV